MTHAQGRTRPERTVRVITLPNLIAAAIGAAILGLTLIVSGCAQKFVEPFRDAPVLGHLSNGAVIGEMPDGFSNWAMKCDGKGHRVYTTYHGDLGYAAITVVRDTACGPDVP
jgi:hypothetical protein